MLSHWILLYWVTSSIPHASRLNLSMHRSNMENANTWRRGYIHGGSREYMLDGANTFTLMKRKLLRLTHEWRHHAYYNVVVRWLQVYIDLKNAWGSGRLRRTKGHLGCRPPKGETAYFVKGTVHNSSQKSFAPGIKCNIGNAVIRWIEVKCIAGKAKPPEENGLKLSN